MKTQSYIIPAILATVFALPSCESDVELTTPAPSDVEIVPVASVEVSRASLSGAVDGTAFPVSTDRAIALSAFLSKDGDTKYNGNNVVYVTNPDSELAESIDTSVPYFLNQSLDTDDSGKFHFNAVNGPRYYPEDGSHVYFYAFSPACATQDPNDHKKVSWTLTGQEDIMYARDLRGIRKVHGLDIDTDHQPQPQFHFRHLLTRLNFRCRRETGFADRTYIESITVRDQYSLATFDLDNESINFSNEIPELIYKLPEPYLIRVAEGYNDITAIMLKPSDHYDVIIKLTSGLEIPLPLKSSDLTWDLQDVNHGSGPLETDSFEAAKSYNVNMRFYGVEITTTVLLDSWGNGGTITDKLFPNND